MNYIKSGWTLTGKLLIVVVCFSIYQFAWGFLLYRSIENATSSLLMRYPGQELGPLALQVFWAESQFQLMKTDAACVYVFALLGMLGLRLMLTPFLNAGLYSALQHAYAGRAPAFWQGVKTLGGSFLLIAVVQWILLAVPLLWVITQIAETAASRPSDRLLSAALPYLAAYLIYCGVVRLAVIFAQIGRACGSGAFMAVRTFLRHMFKACGLCLLLYALFVPVFAFNAAFSLLWPGLAALIVHQAYHLVRTWCKIWEISTYFHFWDASFKNQHRA